MQESLDLERGSQEIGAMSSTPEDARPGAKDLMSLQAAIIPWMEQGQAGLIARWLDKELDADGVPWSLPVPTWHEGLRLLLRAVQERPEGWPDRFDAVAESWLRATLRFSSPTGSPAFPNGPTLQPTDARTLFRAWAERGSDPGLSTVLDWWFPRKNHGRHTPPPLPADARTDRPLAILRANWAKDGDLVAIDHRISGAGSQFALFGNGRRWLGPEWSTDVPDGERVSRARPTFWLSNSSADVTEWSFRVGRSRLIRTAVLLRGRRLALLADQWEGSGDQGTTRFDLAKDVDVATIPESRGLALSAAGSRISARVYPIALPCLPYPTERGSFRQNGRALHLEQPGAGRRVWRPILLSWEGSRNRQTARWRTLTVTEQSKACDPSVAFGARVTWGRDETLLIYRSLGRTGLRAVLGHQTRARFLIGVFTREGEVEPIVSIED
jgi:hypothetical protein